MVNHFIVEIVRLSDKVHNLTAVTSRLSATAQHYTVGNVRLSVT